MIVGSIKIVPTATFADSCDSPILYLLPKENEAIEIGSVAIRIAALPASSFLNEVRQHLKLFWKRLFLENVIQKQISLTIEMLWLHQS
jgi:hypothetical protein